MTVVHGQIESLKKIRKTLDSKGIERFNSTGEIRNFVKNYEREKEKIFYQIETDFDLELDILQLRGHELQKEYDSKKKRTVNRFVNRINWIIYQRESLSTQDSQIFFKKIINGLIIEFLGSIQKLLENNFEKIIKIITLRQRKLLYKTFREINNSNSKREEIISKRCLPKFQDLVRTKAIVEGLNPFVLGAIGENKVVKELQKLSDKNFLLNDFSLDFEPPIYNRKQNERISSIQIDHLLVNNSGIFILETKNWSKRSINNSGYRSPVEQIRRSSYALFLVLNSKRKNQDIGYNKHHWGDKKLPIRNVVVMINEKPKEYFKFVQIKKLDELNRYLSYFEPIFDDNEVVNIVEHLKSIQN